MGRADSSDPARSVVTADEALAGSSAVSVSWHELYDRRNRGKTVPAMLRPWSHSKYGSKVKSGPIRLFSGS